MADFNFKDLIEGAKEAGFETEQLPAGPYADAEVTHTNVTSTQGGGLRVGIRFKVHGGPHDGGGVWLNQMVPQKDKAKSPEKFQQAAAIFLRVMKSLGVELGEGDLAKQVSAIVGQRYSIDVSYKVNGQYTNTNVAIKGIVGAAPAPAAKVVSAPAPVASSLDDDDLDDRPI